MPKGTPTIVVATIPIKRAPFTSIASSVPVIRIPIIATRGAPLVITPSSSGTPAPCTIIPALYRPMNAINRPIPTDIALLN